MADSVSQPALSLHEIKGVVTKFMRMLFPLEFRVDSLTNSSVMLPFHYPLMAGEMIYLPERIDSLADAKQTHDYFFAVAAHLASRHEFGTFDLNLSDIPGFDERGEKGAEAIDCFVAVIRRSRARRRADAAMRVLPHRCGTAPTLSRPRASGREPQPRAGKQAQSALAQHAARAGIARTHLTRRIRDRGIRRAGLDVLRAAA